MFTCSISRKFDGEYADVYRQDGGLYCRVRIDTLLREGPREALGHLGWSTRMQGWKELLVTLSIARDELLDNS
jgi:hypothetical protein